MFEALIRKQIETGILKEEDSCVYQYGYTLITELLINLVITIILGVLMHEVMTISIFFMAFIPLRSFAGGYHADKAWKCTILSNGFVLAAIFAIRYVSAMDLLPGLFLIEAFFGGVIIRMAPVQSLNKKLSVPERNYYKKIVLILYVMEVLIEILNYLAGFKMISYVIITTHSIVTISLMMGKFQMRNQIRNQTRNQTIEAFSQKYSSGKRGRSYG